MATFEDRTVIERPIEEVFAFLHDPANDPKWTVGVSEARQMSQGPMGVGTTVVEVVHFLGRRWELRFEVTEYEPPQKSSIRGSSGPHELAGSYVLEPVNGATEFTMVAEMSARGFLKLIEPIWAPLARRQMRASSRKLKNLLEAEA